MDLMKCLDVVDEHHVTTDEILKNQIPLSGGMDFSGVYLLLKESRVVYVGQSVGALGRVAQHHREKAKDFDAYYIVRCSPECLNLIESHYIFRFRPKYNGPVLPKQKMYLSLKYVRKFLWRIKCPRTGLQKFVDENTPSTFYCYYRVSDFLSFIQAKMEAKAQPQ